MLTDSSITKQDGSALALRAGSVPGSYLVCATIPMDRSCKLGCTCRSLHDAISSPIELHRYQLGTVSQSAPFALLCMLR